MVHCVIFDGHENDFPTDSELFMTCLETCNASYDVSIGKLSAHYMVV